MDRPRSLVVSALMLAVVAMLGGVCFAIWYLPQGEATSHRGAIATDSLAATETARALVPREKEGEAEEAYKALQELVRLAMGPGAEFGKHEPELAQIEYIDSKGRRYWLFRGGQLSNEPGNVTFGMPYTAIVWLERFTESWVLGWLAYRGYVLHDDRPREYTDYINTQMRHDEEREEWNATYTPHARIQVRRVVLYPPIGELDEDTRNAIYPEVFTRELVFPKPKSPE